MHTGNINERGKLKNKEDHNVERFNCLMRPKGFFDRHCCMHLTLPNPYRKAAWVYGLCYWLQG